MITVTILTKNCSRTLKRTLESLGTFSEVLILDSGSTDDTLAIASHFSNVTCHEEDIFTGFGPMHNMAAALASYDWILSIDGDESLSPALIDELNNLALDPNCVYSLPRHNYYNQKHIKWCAGWHPDRVVRLYNRTKTRFSDDLVHEKILKLNEVKLHAPLIHTPYLETSDFLSKMQHYTTLFAKQHPGKPRSFLSILLHSWFAFFKSYILKGGIFGGKEGYIISSYNAQTTFYKYLKQAEKEL